MGLVAINRASLFARGAEFASLGPLSFVRFATKKAAGSKTNNKDSRGRRLGQKKGEGEFVKPGEILVRQRGTLFFPGENCSIGRDHTIFATEPGYVRFYLDPFHPKRKFAGISLSKDVRLPTPHFDARMRRFGREPILSAAEAEKEERAMSRKEWLGLESFQLYRDGLENKRNAKCAEFKDILSSLVDLSPDELEVASERFTSVHRFMKGGRSLGDAIKLTDRNQLLDYDIASRAGHISAEELPTIKHKYLDLTRKLDEAVTINGDLKLSKHIKAEELEKARDELCSQVEKMLIDSELNQKTAKAIQKVIDAHELLTAFEKLAIKKQFLTRSSSDVDPSQWNELVKKKLGKISLQWNDEARRVEKAFIPFNFIARDM